jgi:LPS export ABC transporter protein LptC
MLCSCKNSIEDINALTYKDTFPIESAHDVEMIYSDSGVVMALLKAPIVNRYGGEEPFIILPKGMTVYFFDSVMRVKTSITARYAIKYEKSQLMEARNDVVVVNHIGERLNTERLIWNQERKKIYSDVFVKVTREDEVLYGEGLDADESFDKWNIRKPKGTFYINVDEENNSEQKDP